MTIGIYLLEFSSGKKYVGQSSNIEARYVEHCRKLNSNSNKCRLLQNEFNSIREVPTFKVLERCTLEELNSRERYWIDKLDTFINGLNLTKGGDVEFGEGSPASKYTDKQYYDTLVLLATTKLTCREISETTKVSIPVIRNLLAGKSQIHLKERYPKLYANIYDRKYKYSKDIYTNILNELSNSTISIIECAKKYSVDLDVVHKVINGHYTFLDKELVNKARNIRPVNKHIDTKNITLISPTGDLYKIEGTQVEFAKKHNLNKGCLNQLLKNKLSHHKGWKVYNE